MGAHRALVIFVSALVAFLVGALWYSPVLFAKAWMKAQGHTPEKLAAMQKTAGRAYGVSFLCFLLMAFVLHIVLTTLGAGDFVSGALWGAVIWLGFAFTIGLTANVYSDKPLAAFLIDGGYQLVYLVIMGGIIAGWH